MKKIIEYIKDFYHQDREGLLGGIAIGIFIFILYVYILPIIEGRWKLTKQNFKMKLGIIIVPGIAMASRTFGLECIVKNEFTNQNFNN